MFRNLLGDLVVPFRGLIYKRLQVNARRRSTQYNETNGERRGNDAKTQ